MEETPHFLLCREDENWVVFGKVTLHALHVDALIVVMNDKFSETGQRVKRLCEVTEQAQDAARVRRLQNEYEFWQGLLESESHETLQDDYPTRFDCWSSLEDDLAYVLELGEAERLELSERIAEFAERVQPLDRYFNDAPPDGSRFRFGPVSSNLITVAKALKIHVRTLKSSNGKAYSWIRRRNSRDYMFWFEFETDLVRVAKALGLDDAG